MTPALVGLVAGFLFLAACAFLYLLDLCLSHAATEWQAAQWDAHVSDALGVITTERDERTPFYDALICEAIEREEGWA